MSTNLTYEECLSTYQGYIVDNIDWLQKDYYKQCTYMCLWFNQRFGENIEIAFFKDWEKDYDSVVGNDIRRMTHYLYCKVFEYPAKPSREFIIDFIIKIILNIYKNGNLNYIK